MIALRASSWGRAFLDEHARRARTEARRPLLTVLVQLEGALRASTPDLDGAEGEPGQLLREIAREVTVVLRAESEGEAPLPLSALSAALQVAAETLRDASEGVQEAAWDLRGNGASVASCDILDGWTTRIARASNEQADAVRRVGDLIRLVELLDGRLAPYRPTGSDGLEHGSRNVISIAEHLHANAGISHVGREQSFSGEHEDFGPKPIVSNDEPHSPAGLADTLPEPPGQVTSLEPPDLHRLNGAVLETDAEAKRRNWREAFAEIDALELREKLRLFT